jgi:hypothetical protein
LDGSDDHGAGRLSIRSGEEGFDDLKASFHGLRSREHLGEEHVTSSESHPDFIKGGNKPLFEDGGDICVLPQFFFDQAGHEIAVKTKNRLVNILYRHNDYLL